MRATLVGILASALLAPTARGGEHCGATHTLIGEHPRLANTAWSRDLQGITHDDAHWFITNVDTLSRIPVSVDLAGDAAAAPRSSVPIPPALVAEGFNHFGDLSWYDYAGEGLLCVPMERRPRPAALAFFRGRDLAYLGAVPLPSGSDWAPFCAIDAGGHAVLPKLGSTELERLRIDWASVAAGRPAPLVPVGSLVLRTERARRFVPASYGGAAFSSDGRTLYVLTGFMDDHACWVWRELVVGGCPIDPDLGGIHVFSVASFDGSVCDDETTCDAVRVERSRNTSQHGEAFTYRYSGTVLEAEEPEGITFWDLDDPGASRAPGIRGHVHALMLDNELFTSDDRVSIRHYRREGRCDAGGPARSFGVDHAPGDAE